MVEHNIVCLQVLTTDVPSNVFLLLDLRGPSECFQVVRNLRKKTPNFKWKHEVQFMFFMGHLDSILWTHALYLLNHRSQESHGTQRQQITAQPDYSFWTHFSSFFNTNANSCKCSCGLDVVCLVRSLDPKCGRRDGEHLGGG